MFALTTMADAAPSVGLQAASLLNPTQHVYLIVMTGHFVDAHAFIAPGQPAPSGTTITFTVDPKTQGIRDFGLSNASPDTSSVAMSAVYFLPLP
jgi:hypothetical protein